MNIYALLADLVVFIHLLYVFFAVGGELVILLGWIFRWDRVRNRTFRIIHLCAVILVAIEALSGILCPLTQWEYDLRIKAGQHLDADMTFVSRLIRRIIFYDFPSWIFTLLYVGFAALVVLTFLLFRPKRRKLKNNL